VVQRTAPALPGPDESGARIPPDIMVERAGKG
jgi:hypothetical protein